MNEPNPRTPSILRRAQVQARTGLSRSTIYQYIQDGHFPRPLQLGPRAVGWLESEVSAWIAGRTSPARSASRAPRTAGDEGRDGNSR